MQPIEDINRLVAEVMEEWAREFIARRRAALSAGKRPVNASGELSRRLSYQIDQQARQDAVQLLIAFPRQGRFRDMKNLQGADGGEELIEAIEEWIKEKGQTAKMVRSFMRRHNLKTVPSNVLNRIAWGIVKKRTKRVRGRRIWNKPKSAALTDLVNLVAAQLPPRTSQLITKELNE